MPLRRAAARPARIVLEEERHVLERSQNPEIQQDRKRDQCSPQRSVLEAVKAEGDEEIAGGRCWNESQIEQVPLGVEEVVSEEDDRQREGAKARHRPVEKKYAYQKYEV